MVVKGTFSTMKQYSAVVENKIEKISSAILILSVENNYFSTVEKLSKTKQILARTDLLVQLSCSIIVILLIEANETMRMHQLGTCQKERKKIGSNALGIDVAYFSGDKIGPFPIFCHVGVLQNEIINALSLTERKQIGCSQKRDQLRCKQVGTDI